MVHGEHRELYESDATAELVEQQLLLWNARRMAAHEKSKGESGYRFLTIARDEGSLENEIAQELSRRLRWHVFDTEILTYIAKNSHVREKLVRELDQKSQGFIKDAIPRLLSIPEYVSFGREEYHEALLKTLICLATHGAAILVGRGANFALRQDAHGLNVRVTASPEVRAQRLSEDWKVTIEEARHRMQVDDEERRKFIRHYYKHDFDDACFYDIVVNTDRASAERVASLIVAFMNHPEVGGPGIEAPEVRPNC
jgi:cytidylate kinase